MKKFLVNSVGRLDMIIWILVIIFFCGSALMFNGNLYQSFIAAGGIVMVMILISLSIEVIIETLKDVKGLGTITGFITNGPELVCLIVGLVVGDVLFAASTPLGSNFMNPILLILASLVCGVFFKTLQTNWWYSLTCIVLTAGLAISFFFIPAKVYAYWALAGLMVTLVLFFTRPRVLSFGSSAEAISPPEFRTAWMLEVKRMGEMVGE